MTITLRPVLHFLGQLADNNNKVWFEANRADYEEARGCMEDFVEAVIEAHRRSDKLGDLEPKACMCRPNRDTRFSRDKSPYKTTMGADIAPGGRKSPKLGYHIYVRPGGETIVAGGLYMPDAQQLQRFRQAVAQDAAPFRKLMSAKAVKEQFGGVHGERLKTAPQGFSREHPAIDLLQLKQITLVRHYSDAEVLAEDFLPSVLQACKAMRPFLNWLEETAGPGSCG